MWKLMETSNFGDPLQLRGCWIDNHITQMVTWLQSLHTLSLFLSVEAFLISPHRVQNPGWRPFSSLTQSQRYTSHSFNFTSFAVDLCSHLIVFPFSKVRAVKIIRLYPYGFNFLFLVSPGRLLRVCLAFSASSTGIGEHLKDTVFLTFRIRIISSTEGRGLNSIIMYVYNLTGGLSGFQQCYSPTKEQCRQWQCFKPHLVSSLCHQET